MRKYLLAAAAIAMLAASPVSAQQWLYNQQLDNTVQGMIVDQQLNALAAQTQRNYQQSVNRGLQLINPQQPYGGYCNPYNHSVGFC